jgi:hypothetical protein
MSRSIMAAGSEMLSLLLVAGGLLPFLVVASNGFVSTIPIMPGVMLCEFVLLLVTLVLLPLATLCLIGTGIAKLL